ncbi:MAG: hypothetical protein AAGC47_07485, partial [Bacteroidota bacterium]
NSTILVLITPFTISMAFSQITERPLIPSRFENNLIYVHIPYGTDSLLFYTDTGGKNFLYKSGLKKLELKKSGENLWNDKFETTFNKTGIPLPCEKSIYHIKDKSATEDGMLGREWFAQKVWNFDYQNQKLSWSEEGSSEKNPNGEVPIYFKEDSLGNHVNHLPRIVISIDGDSIPLLLDSGAQAFLSDEAQSTLNLDEKVAISFINESTFLKWKNQHPDWTVIHNGDESFRKKEDIIIVPVIEVGMRKIGPVSFAKRENHNFRNMSILFMDEQIVGALGGNALSLLNNIMIDYPSEVLYINKD